MFDPFGIDSSCNGRHTDCFKQGNYDLMAPPDLLGKLPPFNGKKDRSIRKISYQIVPMQPRHCPVYGNVGYAEPAGYIDHPGLSG